MIFTNRLNISRYLFGEEDHPKSWLLIFKFQFISMWRKGPYMTFHLGTGPAFVVRLRCIIKARQVLICQVSGRISDMSGWLQRLTQFNPEGPSSWPKGLGTWGTCVASQNLCHASALETWGTWIFLRTFEDCKGFQWDIEEMHGCGRCLPEKVSGV